MGKLPYDTTVSITIWAGTPDNLTWTWRKTGEDFLCYLLLPGINNWAQFPLFNTISMSATLAIMADIQTDADTTPDLDERAQYKRVNIDQAIPTDQA
jgi:hypothetical protein